MSIKGKLGQLISKYQAAAVRINAHKTNIVVRYTAPIRIDVIVGVVIPLEI